MSSIKGRTTVANYHVKYTFWDGPFTFFFNINLFFGKNLIFLHTGNKGQKSSSMDG